MGYKDLFNNNVLVQSIDPDTYATTIEGESADRKFSDSLLAIISVGDWTDGTHTFTLEESDDDITFTAVSAAQTQGEPVVVDGATDDNQAYKLGYMGIMRYVRVTSTVTGGPGTGAVYGAVIEKSHLRYAGAHQLNPEV
jgi:hypothetical protein